jgi:alpha-tubulin suppressor-like RCC1 family protein
MYGEVFVCGSLEYGKLGLGKGQKKGYQLKFRKVPFPEDAEIDYINCGVNHMFAITRYKESEKKRAGRTYAWGKN